MTEEQTTQQMLMELIKEECTIDTTEVLEYPPTALSLGEKTIQTKGGDITIPIPIGTYGNFSFVQAPPKTKKTFFASLLASVYLSGGNNFGGKLKGHREGRCLIHFDTEQGHWHSQRVFKRVIDIANVRDVGCYQTYALRTISYKQRIQFIEFILKENKDKNGLVVIDDVADLVSDVKNHEESNLDEKKKTFVATDKKDESDTIIKAPLGGNIFKVEFNHGDTASKEDAVIILEAMKMETAIKPPHAGKIKKIFVSQGDKVNPGDPLFEIV